MSVTRPRLVSTGAALRHAQSLGVAREQIAKVTIDDEEVDPEAALGALDELERTVQDRERQRAAQREAREPGAMERTLKDIGGWSQRTFIDAPGKWLKGAAPQVNDAAKAALDATASVTMARPEDVDRPAHVRITTRDGRVLDVPVQVRDTFATQLLRATSATASGAGFIPVVGNLVQGGTGLVSLVASGASYLLGDKQLGDAFLGMGKKHMVMGLIGFVPVVSLATSPAAIEDMKRAQDHALTVDSLVRGDAQTPSGEP